MILRILCVHDSRFVLGQLSTALEDAGYEVLLAKNGEEALHLLSNVPVDGVVLSYHMYAPDGCSLRNVLRRMYPGTPTLLFSDVDEIRNLPLHVFSEYLKHPGTPDEVLMAVGV